MEKNTQAIAAVLILIVGLGIGYALGTAPRYGMLGGTSTRGSVHWGMQDEMGGMMAGLQGKTGNEFDRAFLSEMIVHHAGAVHMAQAALIYAEHQELKDMATAIISAQTAEIEQMQAWQQNWYAGQ